MRGRLRATLLFLAACFAGIGAARADDQEPDQYDKVRERGVLEVAVYAAFPPYSYERDGRYVGLDIDLAGALAKAIGLPLKVRPVIDGEDLDDDLRNFVWKGSVLGGGTADMMMHVGADPEYVRRQDRVLIFGVYLHESIAIALRSSRIRNFNTLDQLKNRRTAVELGSISDLYLSAAFGGLLRESLARKPTASEAVSAFVKDEVDAVIAPRSQLQGLLKLQGADRDLEPKPVQFGGLFRSAWDIGIAVKAGAPQLKTALDEALVKLENSGELASIYARYGLDYTRPERSGPGPDPAPQNRAAAE